MDLLLVYGAFALLKVFLEGLPCLLLNLFNLLSKVLTKKRNLLLKLLHELLLLLNLVPADLLDASQFFVRQLLHFVDLDVEGVVVLDEALAVLLLNHSDEVVLAVGLLQSFPDARRVPLLLRAAREDLDEAEVRDGESVRRQFIHQLDLVLESVHSLQIQIEQLLELVADARELVV